MVHTTTGASVRKRRGYRTCSSSAAECLMDVRKSENDKNDYRAITLENGLAALLISKKYREDGERSTSLSAQSRSEEDEDIDEERLGVDGEESCDGEQGIGERGVNSDGSSVELTESESEGDDDEENSKTFKSACAVCINAGSLSDPPDIPGLAHLLEHMVFMGSERYEGENTFDSFVSKHGGHSNACTDYETTVFYFTITPKYFQKALDMFAHFFASPLLLESSLSREIEAVDSEFQSSKQSDSDRLQRLLCTMANPDHPYDNFVWGNIESLRDMSKKKGINLVDRLREFYTRHYSSHYMTIAVMSTDSLDVLERWTRASFSAIPNNGSPAPDFSDCPPAFDNRKFHKLYKVVPVEDVNEVQLVWQLPCLFDRYRVKPMDYLGWLLGHEGKGSILYHLKQRNLATDIIAGNSQEGREYNSCFSLFNCTITLTDKGQDQILECLQCVFQYIHLLKDSGAQERIYHEIQTVENNKFNFKEEEDPVSYTEELCEAMKFYPVTDYLTGNTLFLEYDEEVITMVTDLLSPDNVNIMWSSKQFKGQCPLQERWFETPYACEDIPVEWKDAWKSTGVPTYLHLPQPNPFIATDFIIKTPTAEITMYPVLLSEDKQHKLWFRQDTIFKLPKASVCLLLENPVHKKSAKNGALMDMFVRLLEHNMTDTVYNADMAQLKYSCGIEKRGVSITINGFNDKLQKLFKEVIDSIISFSTNQGDFDMVKESLHRSYCNNLLDPEDLCRSIRLKMLIYTYWSSSEKDTALNEITINDLMGLILQFRTNLYIEMLVQGNMTPEEGKSLASYIIYSHIHIPLPPNLSPNICLALNLSHLNIVSCAVKLPPATVVCVDAQNRDPDSPNTVITYYYQCCPRTVRDLTVASFIDSCMAEPAFDDLRTKKQLGYGVYTQNHTTYGMIGLSLTVVTQTAKHSAEWVEECMQDFISGFHQKLQSWSAEEFKSHVESSIQERLQPDVSLEEEVQRNWEQIKNGHYQFDLRLKQVDVLRGLNQADICDWLSCYTHLGENLKKLRIRVHSGACLDTDGAAAKESDHVTLVRLREQDIDAYKHTHCTTV